jgi:hypothetical protein
MALKSTTWCFNALYKALEIFKVTWRFGNILTAAKPLDPCTNTPMVRASVERA